jgi:hypothetical protein
VARAFATEAARAFVNKVRAPAQNYTTIERWPLRLLPIAALT